MGKVTLHLWTYRPYDVDVHVIMHRSCILICIAWVIMMSAIKHQ